MRRIDRDDDRTPPTLSPKAVLRHNYLFRGLSDGALDGIAARYGRRTADFVALTMEYPQPRGER